MSELLVKVKTAYGQELTMNYVGNEVQTVHVIHSKFYKIIVSYNYAPVVFGK